MPSVPRSALIGQASLQRSRPFGLATCARIQARSRSRLRRLGLERRGRPQGRNSEALTVPPAAPVVSMPIRAFLELLA